MSSIDLKQKLIIKNDNKIIYETTNTQVLYLYPLSLKNYVDNMKYLLPIKIDIIKIDNCIDYNIYFNKKIFNRLLCGEITIDEQSNLNKVKEIIDILFKKNVKISLNIKDLLSIPNKFLKDINLYINYYKVFFDYKNYKRYLNKIAILTNNKKGLVHIKSYLDLNEIKNYEKYINDFNKINVDVYQLSKELLPLGKDNIKVDKKYERIIRFLENNYYKEIIFKSVKNLKELYYPRFELDERNSRNCFACRLKPYLYNGVLLPCKVNKMINNINEWGIEDFQKSEVFKRCGVECDDCASIYENDILSEISNVIEKYNKIETIMERNDE